MKIGMITDSLGGLSFKDMLRASAELGLETLEFACGNWSSAPHINLDAMLESDTTRREFVAAVKDHGMAIAALNCSGNPLHPGAKGAEAADSQAADRSPETYVGYARAQNFVGGPLIRNDRQTYRVPATLRANQWSFDGDWTVSSEDARLDAAGGRIVYRFRGRDLHLVLGPGTDGKPVRFRVRIDGKALGADHGMDTDAGGNGTVTTQRLYQLVRQAQGTGERQFEIEFLDPDVRAYAFTFG